MGKRFCATRRDERAARAEKLSQIRRERSGQTPGLTTQNSRVYVQLVAHQIRVFLRNAFQVADGRNRTKNAADVRGEDKPSIQQTEATSSKTTHTSSRFFHGENGRFLDSDALRHAVQHTRGTLRNRYSSSTRGLSRPVQGARGVWPKKLETKASSSDRVFAHKNNGPLVSWTRERNRGNAKKLMENSSARRAPRSLADTREWRGRKATANRVNLIQLAGDGKAINAGKRSEAVDKEKMRFAMCFSGACHQKTNAKKCRNLLSAARSRVWSATETS
ncbi:hypothetical protein TGDOM2_259100 [Toxoplasma gondii GAB2-2007-GAL-DOM2]|uniref:Uncharacterized protein n=1 Tax=Toxoplasma gondii GAB2-2007-GAL-DOM2 TaxID=1130820 RepID=A0A086JP61_TOXGO|nr:hypothetical protein TGDOM2_259100 [Toxoplasma gondii GAB2-2007-GAL-DOM2]